jgi:CBS domain-containing protein
VVTFDPARDRAAGRTIGGVKVRDVMSAPVVTATPDAPFQELVDLLVRNGVSAVPIVDDDGTLLGIVSEADLVAKEGYGGRRRRVIEVLGDLVSGGETQWAFKGRARTACHLMTERVATVSPHDDLRVVARHMVEDGRKRMPVVDGGGKVVGIVSRSDVLRALHRSDDEVIADVDALLIDPMRSPERHHAVAAIHDGVVTVTGSVQFPDDRRVLSAMIWQIPGVVDVRDRTTSREPAPR